MGRSGKGSQFERDFCRMLSCWFTYGEMEDVFWRTGGSGGMATNRRSFGKSARNQEGDISSSIPAGQKLIGSVIFELKKGYNKELDFQGFLDSTGKKPSLLQSWLIKLQDEMRMVDKSNGALVIRRDRRRIIIGLSDGFNTLCARASFGELLDCTYLAIHFRGVCFNFYRWEDFVRVVKPDILCSHLEAL